MITVRLFAGARAAADGSREVPVSVDGPSSAGAVVVADVLEQLTQRHPRTASVLPACSYLLDGVRARLDTPVAAATHLDVLPPFSGG